MFIDKLYSTNKDKSALIDLLHHHRNAYAPVGTVGNDRFKLYRAVSRKNWRYYHYFVFKGNITTEQGKTVVTYRVIPSCSSLLAAAVLLIGLIYGLFMNNSSSISRYMVITFLLFTILFYCDLIWQARTCIHRFEEIIK